MAAAGLYFRTYEAGKRKQGAESGHESKRLLKYQYRCDNGDHRDEIDIYAGPYGAKELYGIVPCDKAGGRGTEAQKQKIGKV